MKIILTSDEPKFKSSYANSYFLTEKNDFGLNTGFLPFLEFLPKKCSLSFHDCDTILLRYICILKDFRNAPVIYSLSLPHG